MAAAAAHAAATSRAGTRGMGWIRFSLSWGGSGERNRMHRFAPRRHPPGRRRLRRPMDPRLPLVAGAGQSVRRPGEDEPADAAALMEEAARAAAQDAGAAGLLERLDLVTVVDSLS